MIERLDQLTIGQFIDLICGDSTVITGGEEASGTQVAAAMRKIVLEYREIADPSGSKRFLGIIEDIAKSRITAEMFRICQTLVSLSQHARVREVLTEYGINAIAMTDERIEAEVASGFEKTRRTVEELEQELKDSPDQGDLRRDFDALTAILMAHFKFQIDTATMKATVYAHLVARQTAEIKAQIAASKKK